MKKIFTLLIILVSLCSVASAESNIDIQNMSTEELVSLLDEINVELLAREFHKKEVTVPPGRYTIGTDIPAGVYTIALAGRNGAMITTFTTGGAYDLVYTVMESSPVGKLNLTDGQTIEIGFESVVFKPYIGIGF